MALISTEQLKAIVKTYLDEADITMTSDEYAALDKVSAVTGLINKIAATFTIEGDYTEEGLADLDGPEITTATPWKNISATSSSRRTSTRPARTPWPRLTRITPPSPTPSSREADFQDHGAHERLFAVVQ